MSLRFAVNREESNAMEPGVHRDVVMGLENLWGAILAAKNEAEEESVWTDAFQAALDVARNKIVALFERVRAQYDLAQAQGTEGQAEADAIWQALAIDARKAAYGVKQDGYEKAAPTRSDHYTASLLDRIIQQGLQGFSGAADNMGLQGEPYTDPVSGEERRESMYWNAFEPWSGQDPLFNGEELRSESTGGPGAISIGGQTG